MTVLRSGSASDVGLVRSSNQDLALEAGTLFAVADGMGGHAGGEVASRLAIDALKAAFGRHPTVAGLAGAVESANEAVWEHGVANSDLRGMGTTLTAVALVAESGRDVLALVNVGDSRSYRYHDGELVQITRDHSSRITPYSMARSAGASLDGDGIKTRTSGMRGQLPERVTTSRTGGTSFRRRSRRRPPESAP